MLRLLYASNTSRDIDPKIVADILDTSRRNNAPRGVTGMLLHLDGGFMQVLEGGGDTVSALYRTITGDKRHWNAQIIFSQAGPAVFKDWSMGFKRLLPDGADQGAFVISKAAIEGRMSPEAGPELMTMLKTFYKVQTSEDL
jgi:hypothetical protein